MTRTSEPETDLLTIGFSGWHGRPSVMENLHRHDEVELNFIEEGYMTYLSGASRVTVAAGQLAVFWAAVPHRIVQVGEATTVCWLTLPLTWFLQWRLPEPFARAILHGEIVLSGDPALAPHDRALFHRWHEDIRESTRERERIVLLEVEARLRRAAISVSSAGAPTKKPEDAGVALDEAGLDKVSQMSRYVAERYRGPLRVSDVARAVGLHPNYASTLFRRVLGVSILAYITQHRVSHAQRLLATTDMSVLAVALASGFGSESRFYAAFKRECSRSPKRYRIAVQAR